jgi:diketogulonate reductase-like aldo/keto reductase
MDTTALALTGRKTTRLGFGCALPAGTTARQMILLLDAAYDAGIRHFDVARSYANGTAEGTLGKFLKRRGGDVTVTTKYGILPLSKKYQWMTQVRNILRPLVRILRRVPAMNRRIAGTVSGAFAATKAEFSPAQARLSLEKSLRELQLDRVDLLLMHEPTVEGLGEEGLLRFLEDNVASGRIGGYGIGCKSSGIPALREERPAFCKVMQFDWSVLAPKTDYPGSFRIHFRTFSQHATVLESLFSNRPDIRRRWSEIIGIDIGEPKSLRSLMLKAALTVYPDSIVLFTSGKPEHIADAARVAEDAALTDRALRFLALVEHEGRKLLAT